jgi:hypothetical protein
MKKNLIAGLLVLTSATAVINPVFSQEFSNDIAYNTKSSVLPSADIETTAINSKAVRDLHKTFTVTGEVKWYKNQNGFTAIFDNEGAKCRVDYDKKGNWNGTLRTYTEDKLNQNIRTIVKSVYFDYSIKWVWELNVPGMMTGPLYIVHVEDEKSFMNLRVHDGEMKVVDQYEKTIVEK